MGKQRKDIMLDVEYMNYLETFGPRAHSKIIQEALELHKNKDKKFSKKEDPEMTNVVVTL